MQHKAVERDSLHPDLEEKIKQVISTAGLSYEVAKTRFSGMCLSLT